MNSVEIQRSLGDAAVRDSTLESAVLFVQKVCNGLTVLKSHEERIGHLYDIKIFCSNNFKFNSLTSYK